MATVEDHARGVTVRLSDGREIGAVAVVLATNGYTAALMPGIAIEPVRAQMLACAPLTQPLFAEPVYAERGYRYFRERDDGVLLVGGCRNRSMATERLTADFPADPVQAELDIELAALTARATVTHRWAGTMGFTVDGLPLVGRVPGRNHLWVCGGYNGHGMGLAVVCARQLASALLDGTALPGWLDSARFVH